MLGWSSASFQLEECYSDSSFSFISCLKCSSRQLICMNVIVLLSLCMIAIKLVKVFNEVYFIQSWNEISNRMPREGISLQTNNSKKKKLAIKLDNSQRKRDMHEL